MFRRRNSSESGAETVEQARLRLDEEAAAAGKGRPTPSRRQAEQARKQRLKPTRNRKELARRERQRRADDRTKVRQALAGGDERHLPARDRGPVRAFVRDLVDARFNVAEFLLPLLVVILLLSFVPRLIGLQVTVWLFTITGTTVDTIWLGFRTRRELARRFAKDETKGALAYAVLRSTQLRRLRLPKPRVARGQPLPEPRRH
ncbi:MAG: DUF3043 domain-containing protein [Nocardioidaceae bacterium]|nr:DUF3043 domain-containing protein [Nocardioidaceae bacterium]